MAKKQESKSLLIISKEPGYDKHKLRLTGLDIDRSIKFHNGERIQITPEELKKMGFLQLPRWLIIHSDVESEIKNEQ